MPLVRYEIRNEHSLANPQLYRTAAKDDPEGLLEGVAMAGLVGIVRQLGDLAEFAAEVFRDLHEEVMATASRGHDLLARVQQLEAEMPAVEKALLSETNQLRFAYTPGVEWHASIRNDQNHCTQGDLPRFIRSSYEECRGPPRLFLLDKFDVAGAGACLKRYTDPSFFRTEWASSELMKAERVQRDKRARREKKKGRRRRNADGKENILAEQYQSTFSHELSRELSSRNHAHPRTGQQPHAEVSRHAPSIQEDVENYNALSRHLAESQGLRQNGTRTSNISPGSPPQALDNYMDVPVPGVPKVVTSSPPKSQKSVTATSISEEAEREWEETGPELSQWDETATEASRKDEIEAEEATVTTVDDGGSEGDQFLDALTTMESEADSDSEAHLRRQSDADVDAGKMQDSTEGQPTTAPEHLKSPGIQIPADEKLTQFEQQSGTSMSRDPSRQEIPQEPRVISGPDAKGTSSSTIGTHSRRQSSESISSVSSRKAKRIQLLEEPHESLRPSSEPSRSLREEGEEGGETESFDQGSVLAFNSGGIKVEGVKVGKIVAAFERGSLDEVHAEELEEHQGIQSAGSDAVNQPTAEADNVGAPEDYNSESNSPSQFCTSPVEVDSASSRDPFPKSYVSTPMRIKVRGTSISSLTSLGSQDSPPDSPTFSALHSPVSPIRTERNLLLSPDRLGRPTETLSPGSPTSVPILAHSPTSQERRHPGFNSPERGHEQVGWEPFSLLSLSSSPQSRKDSEVAPQSLTSNTVMDESPPTSPSSPEDSSHLHSELPTRSLDEPVASIPPVIPSGFLSGEQDSEDDFEEVLASIPNVIPPEFLEQDSEDDFEERHDVSPTVHGSVPTSSLKPELTIHDDLPEVMGYSHDDPILSPSESIDDGLSLSPSLHNIGPFMASAKAEERVQQRPTLLPTPSVSRGYSQDPILSPSESIDDEVSMSPSLKNNGPYNASAKAEGRVQQRPTLLPTSSISRNDRTPLVVSKRNQDPSSHPPLQDDLPPPFLSSVKHANISSLSARSSEAASQFSRDDFLFIPKAAHRRFPSLPLVEKSVPDFSHAAPSISSRSSPGSLIPSKPTLAAQLSAKFGLNAPSPSPTPRIVHDVPYPVRKGAHNRFSSFPSSEGSMLDVSSGKLPSTSAAPSRRAPDDRVPASKFLRDLPSLSQKFGNLPSPTPPSKSERDFPPPPSPSIALYELPPPPPPPPGNLMPVSDTKPLAGIDGGILEAIASHDKGTLKKVRTMQNPVLRKGDERSHLLEQIRAKSFNLRHTVVEKVDSPVARPVTNINVAAILEKANAIRQAFAGSDEDDDDNDDWSDV